MSITIFNCTYRSDFRNKTLLVFNSQPKKRHTLYRYIDIDIDMVYTHYIAYFFGSNNNDSHNISNLNLYIIFFYVLFHKFLCVLKLVWGFGLLLIFFLIALQKFLRHECQRALWTLLTTTYLRIYIVITD